jgi:hypothetical protein
MVGGPCISSIYVIPANRYFYDRSQFENAKEKGNELVIGDW